MGGASMTVPAGPVGFVWTDDPFVNDPETFGFEPSAPGAKIPDDGLDPASEWILGHGQDFDPTRTERRPEEFRYLIAVKPGVSAADALGPRFDVHTELLRPSAAHAGGKGPRANFQTGHRIICPAPIRPRSVPPAGMPVAMPVWQAPPEADPAALVVVAVIDDAINFAHERFRHRGGDGTVRSRVDFAWVQDGTHDGVAPVPYGREWARGEIDAALAAAGGDEEEVLRRLGILDFTREEAPHLAKRVGHGTHVLGTAAGADPDDDAAARRIIAVQLPRLVTRDTSGQQYCAFVLAGLEYILHRVRVISAAVGHAVPVVVNFSYGVAAGSHDGLHFIEQAFDRLLAEHRSRFGGTAVAVMPSGNSNLARGHAIAHSAVDAPARLSLDLPWRLPPGDTSSTFMEIWLPADASKVRLSVTLPDGQTDTVEVGDGPQILWKPDADAMPGGRPVTVIARVTHDLPDLWAAGSKRVRRRRILLALAPTDPWLPHRVPAPAGLWTLSIHANVPAAERIEAWIQRDDTPLGHKRGGLQSYFDHPQYERFELSGHVRVDDEADPPSPVRRRGTLSGLATGRSVVVIGGYMPGGHAPRVADYVGTGSATMRRPDFGQVSDRSPVRPGIRGAGLRSGSVVAMNGTSVAAPHVARILADALETCAHPATFDPLAHLTGQRTVPPILGANDCRVGKGALQVHPALLRAIAEGPTPS